MLKIFTLKHPLEDIPRLTGRKRIRSNSRRKRINENNSSSSSLNLWAREARSGSRARRLILREMRGLWNRDALQMPATRSDRSEANRWSDGIYPLRFNNRVPSPSRKEERERDFCSGRIMNGTRLFFNQVNLLWCSCRWNCVTGNILIEFVITV